MQKKLLLFGGTGFVGSCVARKALERGYRVVVATRSGAPVAGTPLAALAQRVQMISGRQAAVEAGREDYTPGVAPPPTGTRSERMDLVHAVDSMGNEQTLEFVSIDASSRPQVFHLLHDHPDTTAIVSCVGELTRDYDEARQQNGDVSTNIAAGVCHPKLVPAVRKMVLVSAEPYHRYSQRVIGSKWMLKGYFHGKRIGERAVLENLGSRGVVLRPSFIYGTRYVATVPTTENTPTAAIRLPLWVLGLPLDKVLTAVGRGKLLMPPVDVEVVAESAVRVCDWAGDAELDFKGIADVYTMKELCSKEDPTMRAAWEAAKDTTATGESTPNAKQAAADKAAESAGLSSSS